MRRALEKPERLAMRATGRSVSSSIRLARWMRSDCAICVGDASRCAANRDRKSTRLNSSHQITSYAVFCLKKKNVPACGAAAFYGNAGADLSAECVNDG